MNAKKTSKDQATGMKSARGLIFGLIALVVVLIIAAIAYGALAPTAENRSDLQSEGAESGTTSSEGTEQEKVKIPDVALTDSLGQEVMMSQLEGKPLVLNFWASTCGPCQGEMSFFQKAFDTYGDQINFAMVNIPGFNGETTERAQSFIRNNAYTFPVFFDTGGDASVAYGLTTLPRTYFVDAEGYAVAYSMGVISESSLEQGIGMLLEQNCVLASSPFALLRDERDN